MVKKLKIFTVGAPFSPTCLSWKRRRLSLITSSSPLSSELNSTSDLLILLVDESLSSPDSSFSEFEALFFEWLESESGDIVSEESEESTFFWVEKLDFLVLTAVKNLYLVYYK